MLRIEPQPRRRRAKREMRADSPGTRTAAVRPAAVGRSASGRRTSAADSRRCQTVPTRAPASPRRASRARRRGDPSRARSPCRCAPARGRWTVKRATISNRAWTRTSHSTEGSVAAANSRNRDVHRVVALPARVRLDVARTLPSDLDARARLALDILDEETLRASEREVAKVSRAVRTRRHGETRRGRAWSRPIVREVEPTEQDDAAAGRRGGQRARLTPGPTVFARMLKFRNGSSSIKTFSSGHLRCRVEASVRRVSEVLNQEKDSMTTQHSTCEARIHERDRADSPSARIRCPSRRPLPASVRDARRSGSAPG